MDFYYLIEGLFDVINIHQYVETVTNFSNSWKIKKKKTVWYKFNSKFNNNFEIFINFYLEVNEGISLKNGEKFEWNKCSVLIYPSLITSIKLTSWHRSVERS